MKPTRVQPAGMERVGVEPSGAEPAAMKPAAMKPAAVEAAAVEPARSAVEAPATAARGISKVWLRDQGNAQKSGSSALERLCNFAAGGRF